MSKNKFFLIGLLLTLSLLWPLFVSSDFSYHDDVQTIRLYEMGKCFKDRQIPCRWVPDLGGLYGYPLFNYYAPLPYYFGELSYLISGSLLFSVKIMFAVSFVGSFVLMYLFASRFWGTLGGSISAIFYSFAPYHAVDFYVRGAMGEMWAMMFFPAILLTVTMLSEHTNIKNALFFALALAGLSLSHNLSTMLFIPIIMIWIFFHYIVKKNIKFLSFCLAAFLFSLLLSAFYLIPMVAEKNLVHVDTTTVGYFSYTEHFKGLRKLVLERSWGYGASVREVPGGEKDKLSYQIGWAHLTGFILALSTLTFFWFKERRTAYLILLCSAMILLSIFLINPRSQFIWDSIEPLKYLQFPWRFLIITIFFVSFLSGSFFAKERRIITWGILVALVVALNFLYFKPEKFIDISEKELLSGKNWDRQIKRSIYDFLPIFAKEPPAELAKERFQILTGDSKVYDFEEGSNWLKFKADTNSHTILRLSQYYFPDWKIFIDGKETKVEYENNSLGLMTIILGKGNHTIEGRLYDTQIRFLSNLLSFAALIILILFFLSKLKKIREWVKYYRKRVY